MIILGYIIGCVSGKTRSIKLVLDMVGKGYNVTGKA